MKSENELLKVKVSEQEETMKKMQEKMNLDEGVLENLRNIVERDDTKIVNLQTEVRQFKTDVEKKNDKILELEKEAERIVLYGSLQLGIFWIRAHRSVRSTARRWPLLEPSLRLSQRKPKMVHLGYWTGCLASSKI